MSNNNKKTEETTEEKTEEAKNLEKEFRGQKGYCAKRLEGSVNIDNQDVKAGPEVLSIPAYPKVYYTKVASIQKAIGKCEDVIERSKVTDAMIKEWKAKM